MDFFIVSILWICGYVATYAFTYDSIKKSLKEEKVDTIFTAEFLMIIIGIAMTVLWPFELIGRIINTFRKEKK